jgi:hypothetical protein
MVFTREEVEDLEWRALALKLELKLETEGALSRTTRQPSAPSKTPNHAVGSWLARIGRRLRNCRYLRDGTVKR